MPLSAFSDYLTIEKNYSKHTINAYLNDIKAFQLFLNNTNTPSSVSEVTYSEIRSWIVTLSRERLNTKTINRKIAALKAYYTFLVKIKIRPHNPLKHHKSLKTNKNVQTPFSEFEMDSVIRHSIEVEDFETARNQLIIELFYATGIRRTELINLQLSDLNLQNSQLKVLGKRNKERYIPLIHSIHASIHTYLNYRDDITETKNNTYIFLTKKGKKIYPMLVYRVINKYFGEVSTKLKCSPHMLRHSFATHLLNKGADLNAIKELLGHTSLAATQVYINNSMAQIQKVYNTAHPRNIK